jgi:riboflavin synthase
MKHLEKMMSNFVQGVDYEYVVDDKDINSVHIKLITGEYADTVFKYGKVGIEEKDGNAYLQFNFDVIQSPIKKLEKKIEFRNYIGDLLTTIITSQLDVEESYIDENVVKDGE